VTRQHVAYATVFPISDQLPLGQATAQLARRAVRSGDLLASDGVKTGHDPDERPTSGSSAQAGPNRPFGLRFATVPADAVDVQLDAIDYDEHAQIALARDEAGWVPLINHSMGLTLRTTGQIPREDEIHDKSS
jgi:putative ATP-grasp target RiPP